MWSGPRRAREKPVTTAAADRYGSAALAAVTAYATSPVPVACSIRSAAPAPTTVATAPDVVDSAFADTSAGWSTVCGRAADSAARTNRLTEKTTRPAA